MEEIYKKACLVIDSCKTIEQWHVAKRYVKLTQNYVTEIYFHDLMKIAYDKFDLICEHVQND